MDMFIDMPVDKRTAREVDEDVSDFNNLYLVNLIFYYFVTFL